LADQSSIARAARSWLEVMPTGVCIISVENCDEKLKFLLT
jgi:hypothetical protein